MRQKRKPIQQIIHSIIREYFRLNPSARSISTQEIINEARKTELASRESQTVTGKTATKLDESVYQALRELRKKGHIESYKRGQWTLIKKKASTKRPKSLCAAMEFEYETYCHKCKKYYYTKQKKQTQPTKCPKCGSTKIESHLFRYYCPVNHMYISDPYESCVLAVTTDYSKLPVTKVGGAIKEVKIRPCWRGK